MCGQGLKIKMGLQYVMSLFSSEAVKEVKNCILNPVNKVHRYSFAWFWICA